MATWDPATELASARALRALDPAALAPGHGKIVDAPAAAMDAALAKASA
jgi:glyoxylase-like metal-dependent hydrolase (beta-lactamase superfamily II)